MRLRTFTVSLVVAAAATLPLAGVAAAQPDRDCDDFSSQQEAQDALLPGDPERLDQDGDGRACDSFDYGSSPTPPAGGDDEDRDDSADDGDRTADEDGASDTDGTDDDQVSVVPQGGVDTGDGSSDAGSAPLVIAGVLTVGVAAGAAHRRVRANRRA